MTGKNGRPGFTSPIDLDTVLVPDTKPHLFQADTTDLRTIGEDVSTTGHDITSFWSAPSAYCSAPEDVIPCAVFQPMATNDAEGALSAAATALEAITETARKICSCMLLLCARARAFLTSTEGDEGWCRDGISGGGNDKVEELAVLQVDTARVVEDFTVAETECVKAITALAPDGTHFVSADLDGSAVRGSGEVVYGLIEISEDICAPGSHPLVSTTTDGSTRVTPIRLGGGWGGARSEPERPPRPCWCFNSEKQDGEASQQSEPDSRRHRFHQDVPTGLLLGRKPSNAWACEKPPAIGTCGVTAQRGTSGVTAETCPT
ncbi:MULTISPECIES: hypothetical protein [unclassified Nocardiopsis]|uniref:hypothetical protein n=1 Tax=unclassified Nocardiopsis TaxID=2649073 RepID=UPI00116123F4|nr:hypothetical protein [Nocardiopsis sp. TSRI0078]